VVKAVAADAGETLPIPYAGDALLAVDKPSGRLVHRSPID